MTELSFAKSFLKTLDSYPTKLSADHVEDARNFPARSAYILPKMPRPLIKRQKLAPGEERSLIVSLKSLRNPPIDITLSSRPLNTSILNLKEEVCKHASIPLDKIRILYKKKPVGDSKVLRDLVDEEEIKISFSVMILGGAASVFKKEQDMDGPAAQVTQGASEAEVLVTEEFWVDLRAYLRRRLRDDGEADKVFGVFKKAWESEEYHEGI